MWALSVKWCKNCSAEIQFRKEKGFGITEFLNFVHRSMYSERTPRFWNWVYFRAHVKGWEAPIQLDPFFIFRIFRRWTKSGNLANPSVIRNRQNSFEGKGFLCLPSLHLSLRFSMPLTTLSAPRLHSVGDKMINLCGAVGWMRTDKENRKLATVAFCQQHNSTWCDLGSNPCRRGGKPASNHLSYGTILWLT
jgi:hypothetical protein